MTTIKQSVLVSIFVFLTGMVLVDAIDWYGAKQDAKHMTLAIAMRILNEPDKYSAYLVREAVKYMKKTSSRRKDHML